MQAGPSHPSGPSRGSEGQGEGWQEGERGSEGDEHAGGAPQAEAAQRGEIRQPERATGFREVRYPKMDAARRRAEQLLATDPDDYHPTTDTERDHDGSVHLPVLGAAS